MRKIFACLLAVLLLAVAASAQAPFVDDACGLLTPAEAENLESQFSQLYEEYGFAVAVVTEPSMDGEPPAQAAKNAYEDRGYGNDGILLYICEDEGQWYIYTSGLCSQTISDTLLSQVGADLTNQLQAGNHYDAIQSFYQQTSKPVVDVCNDYAVQSEQIRGQNGKYLILGLLGGLAVGIAVAVALGKLARKPIPKEAEPEPVPQPEEPAFEVQIPDLYDQSSP